MRGRERRQLTIRNPTHSTWLLHPTISGEQWAGPDTLTIDPGKAGHYELTYQPMTMTSDAHKHQVRVGWVGQTSEEAETVWRGGVFVGGVALSCSM